MNNFKNSNYDKYFNIFPTACLVWNKNKKILFANNAALKLFKVESIEELNKDYHAFSPKEQPSFSHTIDVFYDKLERAYQEQVETFFWLHFDSEGANIITEISLTKQEDENGEEVIVEVIENLCPLTVDYSTDRKIEEYFTNTLSGYTFVNHICKILEHNFFYWDLRTGSGTFYGSEDLTTIPMRFKIKFPDYFIENDLIHPEDIELFEKMYVDARLGIKGTCDIKGITLDGSYKYFRIKYETPIRNNELAYAITGTIADAEKERALENQAMTDMLTSCYNKVTSESMIGEYLHQDDKNYSTLFIVDIDNFKAINDNLGHQFGDEVLKEMSSKLQSCFRSDDIIGRIGGDEFLILAKHTIDEQIIINKAEKILKTLEEIYSTDSGLCKLSASIGIARFPFDGISFEELFNAADKALYHSKLKGKNTFSLYTSDLVEGTVKTPSILENAGKIAASHLVAEPASKGKKKK